MLKKGGKMGAGWGILASFAPLIPHQKEQAIIAKSGYLCGIHAVYYALFWVIMAQELYITYIVGSW